MSAIREIHLTNSMSGKKEKLETLQPGKITMYSCGPTVYGLIHIGNLRAALVSDLFYRYFRKAGYDVRYVRNYTDVDDKIIQRAQEEKTTSEEIARKYTQEVEKDYAVAGLLEPTHKTKATEHIAEMIDMIETMIQNGHGYVVEGEVLFSIESFKEYGKLSHRDPDDMIAGARVEVSGKKRNPLDFTLWKPAKPGEPSWESPWGKGRPGWHIECSAMARKWLGDRIDIHHGGEDLIFPHHENEIAQSEACSKKSPFARYWVHNAFLRINSEKMSKSLGNVMAARDFLTKFGTEITRYMMLSVHYRSPLDFNEELMANSIQSLERIYEAKLKAKKLLEKRSLLPDLRAESAWGEFVADCEKARREIDACFANDLNTAGALGELFSLIRSYNRVLAVPRAEATAGSVIGSGELIKVMEEEIGAVLGIGRLDPRKALEDLARVRSSRPTESGQSRPSAEEIQQLLDERVSARKAKNFARADEIRDELAARGVTIQDGPQGTTWRYS